MDENFSDPHQKLSLNRILSRLIVGIFCGGIVGALVLGVRQYVAESWQDDALEIEQWVVAAAIMGAQGGAILGGIAGLLVSLFGCKRQLSDS